MKDKMKIGILTLPLGSNFGGVLQAYALLTHLKNRGHEAYLLDRRWDIRNNKTIKYRLQKFIFHFIIRKKVKSFCDKWIDPKTQKLESQDQIKSINQQNFDAFIVGSDQIWRVENTRGVKNNFFLDFVENADVKKIAYAASFGLDQWTGTQEETKKISNLLKDFDAISVRENTGIEICNSILDVAAEHVLDPTLLIPKEQYLKLIKKRHQNNLKKRLVKYILDENDVKNNIIDQISQKLDLKTTSINVRKDFSKLGKTSVFDFYNYIYPSVSSWIRGFRDADFVITDSFHGMVFSIIFQKQFIVIGNERRGLTRFTSLLDKINLRERLITENKSEISKLINTEIDYSEVNLLLNKEKHKSQLFLKNALNS